MASSSAAPTHHAHSRPGAQALDLHIAAECFYREFWDLQHRMLPVTPAMTAAGFKGAQDLPHCELMPENTRICFMRANIVRPRLCSSHCELCALHWRSCGAWPGHPVCSCTSEGSAENSLHSCRASPTIF